MRITLPLRDVISIATSWRPRNGGYIVYYGGSLNGQLTTGSGWVSERDLASVHVDLPDAVRALVNYNKHVIKYEGIVDDCVKLTLAHWSRPCSVQSIDGDHHLIAGIEDVRCHGGSDVPVLTVHEYEVNWFHNACDIPVSYVVKSYICDRQILSNSLDNHWPAWQSRFLVCRELGYRKEMLAKMVFISEEQPSQTFDPGVSFD